MVRGVLTGLLVLIGLAVAGVYLSAFIVHQNERALVLEFGKPKRVIDIAGLNWKIPVVETVEFFDKRILDLDLEPKEIPAIDQKLIKIDAFVQSALNADLLDPRKFELCPQPTRQILIRGLIEPVI